MKAWMEVKDSSVTARVRPKTDLGSMKLKPCCSGREYLRMQRTRLPSHRTGAVNTDDLRVATLDPSLRSDFQVDEDTMFGTLIRRYLGLLPVTRPFEATRHHIDPQPAAATSTTEQSRFCGKGWTARMVISFLLAECHIPATHSGCYGVKDSHPEMFCKDEDQIDITHTSTDLGRTP